MGRMPWALYLWPGLVQVWKRGAWSALVVALGFAVLVNAVVLATLLWTELVPPSVRMAGWVTVGVVWAGSAVFSGFAGRRKEPRESGKSGTLSDIFEEALNHYLEGDWFEAELSIAELLRRNPRDLDAGLLRATLLRHTGRFDEAEDELARLEKFEGWEKWFLEITRERQWLAEARRAPDRSLAESPDGE